MKKSDTIPKKERMGFPLGLRVPTSWIVEIDKSIKKLFCLGYGKYNRADFVRLAISNEIENIKSLKGPIYATKNL